MTKPININRIVWEICSGWYYRIIEERPIKDIEDTYFSAYLRINDFWWAKVIYL